MPHHPSYHEIISGKEAERRLTENSEGNCYLTRYSESEEKYVVSAIVSHRGMREPVHFVLEIDSEAPSYSFKGSEKIFRTIDELLTYYEQYPLNEEIRSIGSICHPPESPDQPLEPRRQRRCTMPSPRQQAFPPLSEEPQNQNEVHQLIEMQKELIEFVKLQQEAFNDERELLKQHIRQMEEQRREEQRREDQPREEQRREEQRREDQPREEQRREEQRREEQEREKQPREEQRREEQEREEQPREEQRREEQGNKDQRREEPRRKICSIQ